MNEYLKSVLKAAETLQEYCYTQDECSKCIFYLNECTLNTEPMEWHDYFKKWKERETICENQIE